MVLSEQQQLFAKNVGELLTFMYTKTNFRCTFGETYRTKEQAEWYAQRGFGIKDSLHCQRLAIDLNIFATGTIHGEYTYVTASNIYKQFGDYWESLDKMNRWGGYFASKYGGTKEDIFHFERKPE